MNQPLLHHLLRGTAPLPVVFVVWLLGHVVYYGGLFLYQRIHHSSISFLPMLIIYAAIFPFLALMAERTADRMENIGPRQFLHFLSIATFYEYVYCPLLPLYLKEPGWLLLFLVPFILYAVALHGVRRVLLSLVPENDRFAPFTPIDDDCRDDSKTVNRKPETENPRDFSEVDQLPEN